MGTIFFTGSFLKNTFSIDTVTGYFTAHLYRPQLSYYSNGKKMKFVINLSMKGFASLALV